jgi:hypothetical protein
MLLTLLAAILNGSVYYNCLDKGTYRVCCFPLLGWVTGCRGHSVKLLLFAPKLASRQDIETESLPPECA